MVKYIMFRVIRAGIGLALTAFLFRMGMSCAEKYHLLGYALMEQAIVFLIAGVLSVAISSIPKESWVWVALLNSLILFRQCSGKDRLNLENLIEGIQMSPLTWLLVASVYYMLIFCINSMLFIVPFQKKRLLALASTLLALLVLNVIALMARL
jgi:hypothetical protein